MRHIYVSIMGESSHFYVESLVHIYRNPQTIFQYHITMRHLKLHERFTLNTDAEFEKIRATAALNTFIDVICPVTHISKTSYGGFSLRTGAMRYSCRSRSRMGNALKCTIPKYMYLYIEKLSIGAPFLRWVFLHSWMTHRS